MAPHGDGGIGCNQRCLFWTGLQFFLRLMRWRGPDPDRARPPVGCTRTGEPPPLGEWTSWLEPSAFVGGVGLTLGLAQPSRTAQRHGRADAAAQVTSTRAP